jgi:hypothetical protein
MSNVCKVDSISIINIVYTQDGHVDNTLVFKQHMSFPMIAVFGAVISSCLHYPYCV